MLVRNYLVVPHCRGKVRYSTLEFEGVHLTQKTVLVADSQKAYIKKILILKDFLPKNQCFIALIPSFEIFKRFLLH